LSQRLADPARDAWQEMAPLCGLTAYLPGTNMPGQNQMVNPRLRRMFSMAI